MRMNDKLHVTNLKGFKNVGYSFDKSALDVRSKDSDHYGLGGESTGLMHYMTF